MRKLSFPLDPQNICAECALALRWFIGRLDGVESAEHRGGWLVVSFDETRIDPETLTRIAEDSIRRLGY